MVRFSYCRKSVTCQAPFLVATAQSVVILFTFTVVVNSCYVPHNALLGVLVTLAGTPIVGQCFFKLLLRNPKLRY